VENLLQIPKWIAQPVRVDTWSRPLPPRHVHILPSLSLGGAEKIIVDLARSWAEAGVEADIIVLRKVKAEYQINEPGITVHKLGDLSPQQRLIQAAKIIHASQLPAYCHLTTLTELQGLWSLGCKTVPVVHNAKCGWKTDPHHWDNEHVPFIVACGEQVADELSQSGIKNPVKVIRHVVPAIPPLSTSQKATVRKAFGASPNTVLIGMLGRIVPQKRYTRAIRLLQGLRLQGIDAKLVIIGGVQGHEGVLAKHAVSNEIQRLGLQSYVFLTGPLANASRLLSALDLFLNTSLYEGVSIATMEAHASGTPVISTAVGGQAEAVLKAQLMAEDATDTDWLTAITNTLKQAKLPAVSTPAWQRQLAAQIWPWSLVTNQTHIPQSDVLFITSNIDVGGAQRSLCNLVAELTKYPLNMAVAISGPIGVPEFLRLPQEAGVDFIQLQPHQGVSLSQRVGNLLSLIQQRLPRHIAFWNMDSATKLAISKCLEGSSIKICDVSPGPLLFDELKQVAQLARVLSTSSEKYLKNLHVLVSKYHTTEIPYTPKVVVIPNGVPDNKTQISATDGPTPPPGYPPELAVVTVGRLHPSKRPDLLPLVAKELSQLVPGASLSVIGGVHSERQQSQVEAVLQGQKLPPNLFFLGPDTRTLGFLPRFACFYMVSTGQGCPNASLEAMMAGIPIVANPDGGTAEQIIDHVTGTLVPDPGSPQQYAKELAQAIAKILTDPPTATKLKASAKQHVQTQFSMSKMANAYYTLFRNSYTQL
jgi:glycosyltransferase involved in cell wall biosynthesis